MLIMYFDKYQYLKCKGISIHTSVIYNDNLVLFIVSSILKIKTLLESCVTT